MTILGEYFKKKSINKASISRVTGITTSRLTRLSRDTRSKLTAEELFLIAKALDVSPNKILSELFNPEKIEVE